MRCSSDAYDAAMADLIERSPEPHLGGGNVFEAPLSPQDTMERLQRLLIVLGSPGKLRGRIDKVRSVSLPEIRPPFGLDRRRPELVFGLLIALVLPENSGVTIPDRPDVNLRRRPTVIAALGTICA